MRILVVNCGSSSLKYTLFQGESEQGSGLIEKIGDAASSYGRTVNGQKQPLQTLAVADHEQAISVMLEGLLQDALIRRLEDIEAVGHRVVHGGPDFTDAARVDERVRNNQIAQALAPLHRVNYMGMEACLKRMPRTPQVAVFDTAFHQTMPEKAYLYALPYRFFQDYRIRKYGFHGTSHKYVSERACQLLKKPARSLKLITLHLGNGASLAAVRGGRCLDTSMGLTPLAGVVMGSRCGDIDPAIVPWLMERENLNPAQMDRLLNKESGLLGLSGVSNDLREVLRSADEGEERSRQALAVFAYSIQKYIGAYFVALGGADALVFTAGIGEKSPVMRQAICAGLQALSLRLDAAKNRRCLSREGLIHARGSKVKVLVIPTREEYMIARETERILTSSGDGEKKIKKT